MNFINNICLDKEKLNFEIAFNTGIIISDLCNIFQENLNQLIKEKCIKNLVIVLNKGDNQNFEKENQGRQLSEYLKHISISVLINSEMKKNQNFE